MSEAASEPVADAEPAIRSLDRSISGSATSPTATATETAMQRWPAEP